MEGVDLPPPRGSTEDPRDRALDYLTSHHVITLATFDDKGPWAAAVFYASRDFEIYFLSSPKSRHSLAVAHEPHVSGTIQEDYSDWPDIKGIQLAGRVAKLEGTEKAAAQGIFRAKFPLLQDLKGLPISIVEAFNRMAWYALTPTELYFVDNSKGFGHRDEVPLD